MTMALLLKLLLVLLVSSISESQRSCSSEMGKKQGDSKANELECCPSPQPVVPHGLHLIHHLAWGTKHSQVLVISAGLPSPACRDPALWGQSRPNPR
ncbi:hypothetical protein JZ751_012899 [Albula glossodonta]|uniref:Uncharacterized protein n=1 Tax=Albula glossodonta TaxID=121402 RepID=A0A8T2MM23_9TELE|nr:hypothetical protein JZ751_012899 [Albula glossodonta]